MAYDSTDDTDISGTLEEEPEVQVRNLPPESQAPIPRGLVNPGEWVYAGSRMPGEAPVQFPTEPPVAGQMPYGISRYDLPGGVRAYHVSQDYQERQRQLDQQAAAARQAAQQAAMDAHLLDQMSRVAKSTKDIEMVRRNIDIMGLQHDIANGVPLHQAVAQHPLAIGTGYGSALRNTMPVPTVPEPTVVNLPGMPPAIRSGRYGEHIQFPPGTGQQPAHKLGEVIVIKDPETGERIANLIVRGPQTGQVEKIVPTDLTPSQQVQVHRARISALNAQLANDYNINDKAEREKAITEHTAQLAAIGKELADMSVRAAPKITEPRSTQKPVPVLGQGTRTDPARPLSQEQFDSLPSKAFFINPADGKLRQKK